MGLNTVISLIFMIAFGSYVLGLLIIGIDAKSHADIAHKAHEEAFRPTRRDKPQDPTND